MDHRRIRERVFIGFQYLLPQHGLSGLVRSLSRARIPWFRALLIRTFLRIYPVDLAEAASADPSAYGSFNEFFTRRLRPGARAVTGGPGIIVCPVDGYLSQAGRLAGDTALQAKGIHYSIASLLGDAALALRFAGGSYATLYLAPHNYHRVHMPLAGTLRLARLIPGALFSVNAATAAGVPGLYTRNERVACVFETQAGPMAVVLVGALCVGSMSLAWEGELRPLRRGTVRDLPVRQFMAFDQGAELGWFNLGSTVILAFGPAGAEFRRDLVPGSAVRVGEPIGAIA